MDLSLWDFSSTITLKATWVNDVLSFRWNYSIVWLLKSLRESVSKSIRSIKLWEAIGTLSLDHLRIVIVAKVILILKNMRLLYLILHQKLWSWLSKCHILMKRLTILILNLLRHLLVLHHKWCTLSRVSVIYALLNSSIGILYHLLPVHVVLLLLHLHGLLLKIIIHYFFKKLLIK